jgi:predicted acetyltransferase
VELVAPAARYRDSYLAAEHELLAAGELATPLPFDDHLRALAAQQALIESWLVDGDEYLGKLHLRPRPEPAQGHLGCKVRPSRRRCGLALHMCTLALPRLAELGVDPAVATCAPDNAASLRIVARLGGVLIDRLPDVLRFSIATRVRSS